MKHYENLIDRLRSATKLPILQALCNEAADEIERLEAELIHAVVDLGPKAVPSRICAICGEMEYPQAQMATTVTWICPECAKKIGKLIGVRTES